MPNWKRHKVKWNITNEGKNFTLQDKTKMQKSLRKRANNTTNEGSNFVTTVEMGEKLEWEIDTYRYESIKLSGLDHFAKPENFFANRTFASFAWWTRWFCILSFPWLRRIRHFHNNLLFFFTPLYSLCVSLFMQILYGGLKSGVTGVTQDDEFLNR